MRSVLAGFCVLGAFAVAAADPSPQTVLCASLSSLADVRNVPQPDGLVSAEFTSLDWITENCQAAVVSGTTHVEAKYTSQPVIASVNVLFSGVSGVSTTMSCARQFYGSLDTSTNVLLEQSVSLSCQVSLETALRFTLTSNLTSIPADALVAVVPYWTGRIVRDAGISRLARRSKAAENIFLDDDLFDGAPAIRASFTGATATQSTYLSALFCQKTLELLPFRMPPLQTVPSLLSGSLLAAFGSSCHFPNFTSADLPLASVVADQQILGTLAVRTVSSACAGATCEDIIGFRLSSMVTESARSYCSNPTLVPNTMTRTATLTLLVNETHAMPRALAAVSTAIFSCPSPTSTPSYIGITVKVRSPANASWTWPVSVLMDTSDLLPAIGMQQQIAFSPSGRIAGQVHTSSGLVTPVSIDLFSSRLSGDWFVPTLFNTPTSIAFADAGGLVVPDAVFDVSTAPALAAAYLARVQSCLATPVTAINTAVKQMLTIDASSFTSYAARTTSPTWNDFFLATLTQRPNVRFTIAPSGQYTFTVVVPHLAQASVLADAAATAQAQQALQAFGLAVKQANPSLADRTIVSPSSILANSLEALFTGSCVLSPFAQPAAISAVPTGINYSATLDATLSFEASDNSLFASVELSFDYMTSVTSMFATVNASTPLVYSYDYLPSSDEATTTTTTTTNSNENTRSSAYNQLMLLGTVNQPVVLGQQLQGALVNCSKMELWTTDDFFSPLSLSIKHMGNTSWSQFLGQLTHAFQSSLPPLMSSLDYAHHFSSVTQSLRNASDLEVFPGILRSRSVAVTRQDGSTVLLSRFVFDQLYMTQIVQQNMPWALNMDTLRTPFPVLVRIVIAISATLKSGSPAFVRLDVSVDASSDFPLFSTAVQSGSSSGTGTIGNITLRISFPADVNNSQVAATTQFQTLFGVTGTATVLARSIGANTTKDLITDNATTNVEPDALLSTIGSAVHQLLPMFMSATLTEPFAPLASTFSSFSNVPALTNLINSRLSLIQAPSTPLATSAILPFTATITAFSINVSVNKRPVVGCPVPATTLSPSLPNTLAAVVQRALCSCGGDLCNFLRVVEFNRNDTKQEMGIGFEPAIPGILHKLQLNASASNVAMQNVSWNAPLTPMFTSWRDVSELSYFLARGNIPYSPPLVRTVQSSEVVNLIPSYLQDVYPTSFPAVDLPFFLSFNEQFSNIALQANATTANQSVTVWMSNTTTGRTLLSTSSGGRWFMVFGASPLGANSILFTTNFTKGSAMNFSSRVQANTSAFDIEMQLEFRGPGGSSITPVFYSQHIVLPTGQTYVDALVSSVVPALDPRFRAMLNVYVYNISRVLQPQVLFNFSAIPAANASWLVPLSIAITNSQLPCLSSLRRTPPTTRSAVRDVSLRLTAAVLGQTNNATAQFGVNPVNVGATTVTGIIDINTTLSGPGLARHLPATSSSALFNMNHHSAPRGTHSLLTQSNSPPTSIQLLDLLPGFRSGQFYKDFDTLCRTMHNISLNALDILDASLPTEDPSASVNVLLDEIHSITSDFNFSSLAPALKPTPSVGGLISTIAALRNMLAATQATLCEMMQRIDDAFMQWASHISMRGFLPFSNVTIGSLLQARMAGVLTKAVDTVCAAKQLIDINTLCGLLGNNFAADVCEKLLAGEKHLQFTFVFLDRAIPKHAEFTLDTSFLTISSLGLPAGEVSSKGDIYILFDMNIQLQVLVSLDGPSVKVELGSLTHASFTAQFNTSASMMLWFGPLLVSAADTRASIGNPVTIEIAYDPTTQQFSPVLTGRADMVTMFSASGVDQSCQIFLTIPDLFKLFTHDPNAIQLDDSMCFGGDILGWFEQALEANSIVAYFDVAQRFTDQLADSLARLADFIFQRLGIGAIKLPVIETLLSELGLDFLLNLLNAETIQYFGTNISSIVQSIRNKGDKYPTPESQTNYLWAELTKVICTLLPVTQCPPPPTYSESGDYSLPLPLGKAWVFPLPKLAFDLEAHGVASLTADCSIDVTATVGFKFYLVYNSSHGVHLQFGNETVLTIDLKVATEPGCAFSGAIGYLATVFDPMADIEAIFALEHNAAKWTPTLTFDGHLVGDILVGMSGPLSSAAALAESISTLPDVHATLTLGWVYRLGVGTLSRTFKLTNVMLCVGTFVTGMLKDLAQQMLNTIQPLDQYLGPDGLFLRDIPVASFLFGRPMNLLELVNFVSQLFGGPSLSDAITAVESFAQTLQEIEDYLNLAAQLEDHGSPGCAIRVQLQNFSVDFSSNKPVPIPEGEAPSSDVDFSDDATSLPSSIKQQCSNSIYSMQTSKAKLSFPFMSKEGALQMLVDLMLGVDFPLMILQLPAFSINVHPPPWIIPVWEFPRVDIVFDFSGSFHMGGLEIGLSAHSAIAALRTRNIGLLFSGLGYLTRDFTTNQVLPPVISGSLRLSAGARVSIFIFTGGVNVYGEIDASFSLTAFDGRAFVTFEALWWVVRHQGFQAIFDYSFAFSVGLEFYIKACIPLLFKDICWTVVDWSIGTTNNLLNKHGVMPPGALLGNNVNLDCFEGLPQLSLPPSFTVQPDPKGNRPAPSKAIISRKEAQSALNSGSRPMAMTARILKNGAPALHHSAVPSHSTLARSARRLTIKATKALQDTVLPRVQYSHSSTGEPDQLGTNIQVCPVQSLSDGTPCRSGTVTNSDPVGVTGSYDHAYEVLVGYVVSSLTLPSSTQAQIVFDMSEYTRSGNFSLSTEFLTCMDGVSHGAILGQCQSLSLINPSPFTAFAVSGTPPCPVNISSTSSSNVTVSGVSSSYLGPLHLNDLQYLTVKIANEATMVMTDELITMGSVQIHTPTRSKISNVFVFSGPSPTNVSTFYVDGVAVGRSVEIDGNSERNFFIVNQSNVFGSLKIVGGIRDQLDTFILPLPGGYSVLLGVAAVTVLHPTQSSVIQVLNIPNHIVNVSGVAHASVNVFIGALQPFTNLVVNGLGVEDGDMNYVVSQCDTRTPYTIVQMQGPGKHQCNISKANKLDSLNCNIEVFGSTDPNSFNALQMDASADPRELVWIVGAKTISVQPTTGTQYLQVTMDSIDTIEILFGPGGNTVRYLEGVLSTDVILRFHPDSPQPDTVLLKSIAATLLIDSASSVVLGEGAVQGEQDPAAAAAAVAAAADQSMPMAQVGNSDASSPSADPFSLIYAPLVIVGSTRNTTVTLTKGNDARMPAQGYHIDEQCLARLSPPNQSSTTKPPKFNFSSFMTSYLTQHYGLDVPSLSRANCSVPVLGLTNFFISTGPLSDLFVIENNAPSVELHSGDEISLGDVCILRNVSSSMIIDLGRGADQLIATLPLGPTAVWLGADTQPDSAFVSSTTIFPNVNGAVISPVGPAPTDVLTINQQYDQDSVQLDVPNNARIFLNITQMAQAPYILATNTTYVIVGLASGTTPKFMDATPSATNWAVELALPSWQSRASVTVLGKAGTNGTIVLRAPPCAPGSPDVVQLSSQWQRILASNIELDINAADQILLTAQSPAAAVRVLVEGTPSSAELAIVMDALASQASSVTVSTLTGNLYVANVALALNNQWPAPPQTQMFAVTVANNASVLASFSFGPALLNSSCITFQGTTVAPNSPWLAGLLDSQGIDPVAAAGCAYYVSAVTSLSLTTPQLRAVDISRRVTRYLSVIGGNLSVHASTPALAWPAVRVSGAAITRTDDNTTLTIVNAYGRSLTLDSSLFLSTSSIELNCPAADSPIYPPPALVQLGDQVPVPQVQWRSVTCAGSLSFGSITPDVVVTSGQGLALTAAITSRLSCGKSFTSEHVHLQVHQRSVIIGCPGFNASQSGAAVVVDSVGHISDMNHRRETAATLDPNAMSTNGYNISWAPSTSINSLTLLVEEKVWADVLFVEQPITEGLLHVSVGSEPTVSMTVLTSSMAVLVPSPIHWVPETQALEIGVLSSSSSLSNLVCVTPHTACSSQAWLDIASYGFPQCMSPSQFEACLPHVVAVLSSPSPLYCSTDNLVFAPAGSAPPFGTNDPASAMKWKKVIGAFYYFAVVVTTLEFTFTGQFTPEPYLILLLTAFATLVVDPTRAWDAEIRALVNAAHHIIVELFAGSDCAQEGAQTGTIYTALNEGYFGLCFLVLLLVLLAEYWIARKTTESHYGNWLGGWEPVRKAVRGARRLVSLSCFLLFTPFLVTIATTRGTTTAVINVVFFLFATVASMLLDALPEYVPSKESSSGFGPTPDTLSSLWAFRFHMLALVTGTVMISVLGTHTSLTSPAFFALFIAVLGVSTLGTVKHVLGYNVAMLTSRYRRLCILIPTVGLSLALAFYSLLMLDPANNTSALIALWVLHAIAFPFFLTLWRVIKFDLFCACLGSRRRRAASQSEAGRGHATLNDAEPEEDVPLLGDP